MIPVLLTGVSWLCVLAVARVCRSYQRERAHLLAVLATQQVTIDTLTRLVAALKTANQEKDEAVQHMLRDRTIVVRSTATMH
ncbi:MAG: hypothetical protein OEW98_00195 [Betaproteobacteria bacterium]|nr:hypothetical protein [Betaproteobacteria bacterium]